MNGDWFYTAEYGNFVDGGKATQRSQPDNLTRRVITQSVDFTRKGEKIAIALLIVETGLLIFEWYFLGRN